MIFILGYLVLLLTAGASAQGQISPTSFVSVPGGQATFLYLSNVPVDYIFWRVNGELVELGNDRNMTVGFQPIDNLGYLHLENISTELNRSTVSCEYMTSGKMLSSPNSTLLLQGHLSPVSYLTRTLTPPYIFLTWIQPFSLDISGVSPDVTYCVRAEAEGLQPETRCGIESTEFLYQLPPHHWCYNYTFTVTPQNLVGMGNSSSISYMSPEPDRRPVVRECVHSLVLGSEKNFSISWIMSSEVCSGNVTIFNDDTKTIHIMKHDSELIVDENDTITITAQLELNSRYSTLTVASNSFGNATSPSPLSTHDIMNATIVETQANIIELETLYYDHSTASGALFSFVFITESGDVDFSSSFLLALDDITSHRYTLPFDLYPGRYDVFAYDIEQGGILANGVRYPAIVQDGFPSSGNNLGNPFGPTKSSLENCHMDIRLASDLVIVECDYRSGSMATGFQVMIQQGNVAKVHKIFVGQATDRQSRVSVEVEMDQQYELQVAVIATREGIGILDSNVEYVQVVNADAGIGDGAIAGVVLAVIILLATATVSVSGLALFLLVSRSRKKCGDAEKNQRHCRSRSKCSDDAPQGPASSSAAEATAASPVLTPSGQDTVPPNSEATAASPDDAVLTPSGQDTVPPDSETTAASPDDAVLTPSGQDTGSDASTVIPASTEFTSTGRDEVTAAGYGEDTATEGSVPVEDERPALIVGVDIQMDSSHAATLDHPKQSFVEVNLEMNSGAVPQEDAVTTRNIYELNKRPEKGKHATADIFFNNVYVSTQGSYLERKSYGFNYVYHKPCSANRSKDDYSIEVMDDEIVFSVPVEGQKTRQLVGAKDLGDVAQDQENVGNQVVNFMPDGNLLRIKDDPEEADYELALARHCADWKEPVLSLRNVLNPCLGFWYALRPKLDMSVISRVKITKRNARILECWINWINEHQQGVIPFSHFHHVSRKGMRSAKVCAGDYAKENI